jgi:hypothetical protein
VREPGIVLITVRRTGGVADLRRQVRIDTDELPRDLSREVAARLAQVDIAELERRSPVRCPGAERYRYELTVTRGAEEHHVVFDEGCAGEPLDELVDLLMRGRAA